MATVSWANPGTSGNASTGPWDPSAPQSTDDVMIGGSSAPYIVTLDVVTFTLNSVTVGTTTTGGTSPGSGNVTLAVGANTLNATTALTLDAFANTGLTLQGGVVTTAALGLGANSAIVGFGTLNATSVSGSGGFIVASSNGLSGPHVLEIGSSLGSATGVFFAAQDNGVLQIDGPAGAGQTIAFLDATGKAVLLNDTGLNITLSGMTVGASGALTNAVDIAGVHTIASVSGQGTTSGTITLDDGAVLNLTNLSSANWFINTADDGGGNTLFYVSDTACYCRGTKILTESGEVAVEDLVIGDRIITASGEARPIKWLGHRAFDGRFIAGDRSKLPIRIAADALADNVPVRDLWVSPEHALYCSGVLAAARLLVNGQTIVQADRVERVEYFHVELDTHDVIFADGAPAESYVECNNRGMFQNAADFATRYPGAEAVPAEFCAPRMVEGAPELSAIRTELAQRASTVADRIAA